MAKRTVVNESFEFMHPQASRRLLADAETSGPGRTGRLEPVERRHLISPETAVQRARNMLNIERNVDEVSDSLFDTIVANEIGSATALAARMVGDYRIATEVVHDAFENARAEFSSYDGEESPRSWILGYVAEEAVARSMERFSQAKSQSCDEPSRSGTEAALNCLRPERRLAVILTDVLGMTDEAAARIARVDLGTVRQRAATARSWIARHLNITDRHDHATDGAMG